MRVSRERELTRVAEKGVDVDPQLISKCAYYPLFRFVRFIDKETGELIQGQQLVCKDCSIETPNKRCKRSSILSW